MSTERKPAPAEGALRCGRCERKLVLDYLRHMAGSLLREDAPGKPGDRTVMSRTLRNSARSIENGVHERGVVALPLCDECGEDE